MKTRKMVLGSNKIRYDLSYCSNRATTQIWVWTGFSEEAFLGGGLILLGIVLPPYAKASGDTLRHSQWLATRSPVGAKCGGGGSRTPVRELDSRGVYMLSLGLKSHKLLFPQTGGSLPV